MINSFRITALRVGAVLVLGMALVSSVFANAPLIVSLPSEDIVLQFSEPQRISQVLYASTQYTKSVSALATPRYNRLFDKNKSPSAKLQQQRVADQLLQTALSGTLDRAMANHLAEQVKTLQVGHRVFESLDYDQTRLNLDKNPVLAGEYSLEIIPLPDSIKVMGLVTEPLHLPYDAKATVADYLAHTHQAQDANPNIAWLIYPDGKIERSGYAYWNNARTKVPAGSTLFVGFDTKRSSILELEHSIASLIANAQYFHQDRNQ